MADNTVLSTNIGTGDTVATDDIGGVKYPRGKIVIGADGTNDGDVSATNPLPIKGTGTAGTPNAGVVTIQGATSMTPVQIADNSGSITVDGTVAATQSGTWTVTGAGGTFPVTDSSGSLTVDAPVGTPVFVRLSDGTAAIATLPVSLASVPSHAVTNAGTFAVQVDGTALTRLTDIETNTDSCAVVGNGVAATAQRVTIASDSTGVIAVTDNSGSLTVDNGGTFAVQAAQSGTWNITNVSGTISLPTGAATAAKQPALGIAGSASADVITIQGIASGTVVPVADGSGSLTVDAPVGTPVFVRLSDGTSAIATLPVSLASLPALVAGSALIGKVGIDQTTPGTTNAVQDIAATSGGLSISSFLSTAAAQATQIKGSAGQVYALEFFNISATPVYVRLYNQTGAPAGGDNANIIWRGMVPGNTAGAGFVKTWDKGLVFSTGIGMRCTGAIADTDTTALSANVILGNVCYK